jgi:hypothetical protein
MLAQPRRAVSLGTVRWRWRAPRVALLVTCALLSLAGLRAVIPPVRSDAAHGIQTRPSADVAELGFAQSFVRSWLSGAPNVAGAYGGPDDGLPEDRLRSAGISAMTVVGWQRRGTGSVVTVAADAPRRRRWFVAVTIRRDLSGRLALAGPPAIVGPPAVARPVPSRPQLEVSDRALRAVVARVMRHYLGRDRGDLAADLAPRVVVSVPAEPLSLVDVFAVTWVAAGTRVAATVVARDRSGDQLTLRYELPVGRVGGRWLVRGVHTDPTDREVSTP